MVFVVDQNAYSLNLEQLEVRRRCKIFSWDGAFWQSLEVDGDIEEAAWKLALPGFHSGPIIAMDLVTKTDQLVTVSSDLTARIWSLFPVECEVCHSTPEVPLSVAIHPCGFEVAIGYRTSIQLHNVTSDALLPTQ